MKERLDVVGYWTEIKLQILQEYANAYAQVLKNQRSIKHVAYIDGFAGAGATAFAFDITDPAWLR